MGVVIEDQFLGGIPNNSIIISSGSHVNVLCHTASKEACSGRWFRPGDEITITDSDNSGCMSTLYSYVNLTIVREQNSSGIYTCTIRDENNILQSVYIGVYYSVEEIESKGELYVHLREFSGWIILIMSLCNDNLPSLHKLP